MGNSVISDTSNFEQNQIETRRGLSARNSVNKNKVLDFENWRKLIKTLNTNLKLNNYVLSKNRIDNIDELKRFLLKSTAKNDTEKVWSIFLWITHNIDYDFDGIKKDKYGEQDANSILKSGFATSSGFSNLFNMLCDSFNIKSVLINGFSKGYGYNLGKHFTNYDHNWNAVYIDKKWYLVESTWASGYCNDEEGYVKRFQPYYFFTPPEIFIHEHLPEDSNHQFLNIPLSLQEFEVLPFFKIDFFVNGLKCLSHSKATIESHNSPFKIEFEAPDNVAIESKLFLSNKNEIKNTVLVQRDIQFDNIIVEVSLQSNEKCSLSLFSGKKEDKSFRWIADFEIIPSGTLLPSQLFCKTFSFPKNIFLFEPKVYYLKTNFSYIFQVYIEAFEVAVFDLQREWTYFQKDTTSENIWILKYKPQWLGNLTLSAKLTNESKFITAFEYEVVQ
jgi:hypothetical protein